jgi:ribosomal protein S18 acetylase RimI-like enzyme
MEYALKQKTKDDYEEVLKTIRGWGSEIIVSRGKTHSADSDGIIAWADGKIAGLCLYSITGKECEIVLLEAFHENSGIGTALIEKAKEIAGKENCKRLWLITSNDNIDAIRFYQKKGFNISNVYVNAMEESRRIKPEIPYTGNYGIPVRDEIEFEMNI